MPIITDCSPAFDAGLRQLLDRFAAHDDLRRSGADVTQLARSNWELHHERMAMAEVREARRPAT